MSQTADNPEQTRAIVVDYHFPEPPAKVWRALTEPALLGAWLMPNDIRPEVGHNFTFQAPPVPGWDGIAHCEVLAVEPLRLLRYSWRGGNRDIQGYGHYLDTVVTWTLSPAADGGSDLRLVHDGFTAQDTFAYENMGEGWRNSSRLPSRLAQVLAELG